MSKQWAENEAKLGFSGPPSEIGWADHEEVVEVLESAIRKAWGILYAALDDSPVIQQDLRPGDWQRLKYGALDAMHTLEHAMGGQSMSRREN